MDLFFNISLAFLEMSFLLVLLLLMHGLRSKIGAPAVYLSLGGVFVFTQLFGTFGLAIETGYVGMDVQLTSGLLSLPILAGLVVIYIIDGTFAMQRIVIGMILCFAVFLYLTLLTAAQIDSIRQTRVGDIYLPAILYMARNASKLMAANVIAFALDIFLLPFLYQWMRNLRINLFLSVTVTLFVIVQIDSFFYSVVVHWGEPDWWLEMRSCYVFNALMAIWFSIIVAFYLHRVHVRNLGDKRKTFDIFLAFFGNYGKRLELEKSLQASEERYEILFRSAIANILLVSDDGVISEVNQSTLNTFSLQEDKIIGKNFHELVGISSLQWKNLVENNITHFTSAIPGKNITLDMNMNHVSIRDTPMLLIHCRDISENLRREQERIAWQEQASHRERLASIGELAGGIAHDFNNYLQTIQGHLDNILYFYPVSNENAMHQLQCIDSTTQKAATLTKQLLGFARRGKYNVVKIKLADFVDDVATMFRPIATNCNLTIDSGFQTGDLFVMGDTLQLQQVLINILMNARDALKSIEEQNRCICISFGTEANAVVKPNPPADSEYQSQMKYAFIAVRDTGNGIPDDIRGKIFEPFFTTKKVGEGTGMGLSMAYGILLSHKGWIQVDAPSKGPGTVFSIFLPLLTDDSNFESFPKK